MSGLECLRVLIIDYCVGLLLGILFVCGMWVWGGLDWYCVWMEGECWGMVCCVLLIYFGLYRCWMLEKFSELLFCLV